MEQLVAEQERRILVRFNLKLRSILRKLQDGEEVLELFTRDVSSQGAFFLTDNPLPVETNLSMTMFIPFGRIAGSKLSIAGKVVRTETEGMAVRFDPSYSLVPAA